MKKLLNRVLPIALAIMMLLTYTVTFGATSAFGAEDGNVSYKGISEGFVMSPGSDYSLTDLFAGAFEGVMPGDELTQDIVIKNDSSKNDVEILMRALGADDETKAFLDQLDLEVEVVSSNGTKNPNLSTIFDAKAGETAQLTDWVKLGDFPSGSEVTLRVTLKVPYDLGNEYAGKIGFVNWEFMSREYEQVTVSLGVSKTLAIEKDGKAADFDDLTEDEQANVPDISGKYTFTLEAAESEIDGIEVPVPETLEVVNVDGEGGVALFGDVTFYMPGTYTYKVTESGSVDGVTNDSDKEIVVNVTADADGVLSASVTGADVSLEDGEAIASFTNTCKITSEEPDDPDKPGDDSSDPKTPDKPSKPNTGDQSNIQLYVGIVVIAVVLLFILFFVKRRKEDK